MRLATECDAHDACDFEMTRSPESVDVDEPCRTYLTFLDTA